MLLAVIFAVSSFAVPLQANETLNTSLAEPVREGYARSIIDGLAHGMALQYFHQGFFYPSYCLACPLEFFYYIEDEFFQNEGDLHRFCKNIGAIGMVYHQLLCKNLIINNSGDREELIKLAIIHACDGNYEEFISKDPLTFYKAVCKMLVRSATAASCFVYYHPSIDMKYNLFDYRYALFEALIPLVDLIEKIPALRNVHSYNKKRLSRLTKSLMRCIVYAAQRAYWDQNYAQHLCY